jgi:hypothetical protein
MTKYAVAILLALTMPANAQTNPRSTANDMLSGCKGFIGDKTPPSLREALGQGRCGGYVAAPAATSMAFTEFPRQPLVVTHAAICTLMST